MSLRLRTIAAVLVLCLAVPAAGLFAAGPNQQAAPSPASPPPDNELDAFMAKVLARREVNRKTLEQYVLDETERFEILGPGRVPLHRTRREYTWYVRDGMHVRSPVRFNGVGIGEEARKRYESDWIHRERERIERKAKKEKDKGNDGKEERSGEVTISSDGIHISNDTVVPTEPRFVSEAYFMDFKFEAGNYYLAGRELLEGQEVLKVEYYPTRLFNDDEKKDQGEKDDSRRQSRAREREDRKEKETEAEIERRMNKTALVTLWIDPREHQIVKYTFENVWMDFLPGAWLLRMDDIRASMTMGQPFPGVWLPREMNVHAGFTLAAGSFEGGYARGFSQYRLAEVTTKMTVPKQSRVEPPATPANVPASADEALEVGPHSGPFVDPQPAQAAASAAPPGQAGAEVVREIRIHGNAFLTDQEVLDIAGVAVGQALPANGVEAITKRLQDSRRFETIDVRKRYRSLTSTTDVALVLVVHERPGVRSATANPGSISLPRPVGRLRSKLMFLPIVSFADGYGFTYGGRASTIDLLGAGERLSVPLTWGGTRRAALEFDRGFKHGPLTRVESSVAIWNRKNPRFEIRDQRVEVKARAERVFADLLRLGADASRSSISFGALDDSLWTTGTTATVDTRLDPAFPGNAVLLSTGWTGMHFRETPGRIDRYTADGRGYLRVFRQVVVAGRAAYVGADARLPPYERLLLGGSGSVRGFSTGSFDGDRTFVTAAEVRVPVTSVLHGAKLGVNAFIDAGKAWDFGTRREDAEWRRGVGGGIFLIASIVRLNLDVARGLKNGGTHLHLSSGFTF